jgi:hypothetical protein
MVARRGRVAAFTIHPEYGMLEYACHEGNYAMKHILSGARAEETAPQPIQ